MSIGCWAKYTCFLSLSFICHYRNTDCIVLSHNDDVLQRVQKQKKHESVSFSDLNDAIASHLSGIFLPTDSLQGKRYWEVKICT